MEVKEEDNKQLLMKVLHEHYKGRYSLVEEALTEINNYSKNPNKNSYRKTLDKLYSLMNGDLPPKILLYFLTMVPLPIIDESKPGDVFGMMKKTHDSLPKNMRPILLTYLEQMSAANDMVAEVEKAEEIAETDENYLKLVDICARYVFTNMEGIKKMYKDKNESVWKLIYSCEDDEIVLRQCYKTVAYLNKQRKLLRMIEDHEISLDVFEEAYGNSDVFAKRSHLVNITQDGLMENADLLTDAIARFAERC